MKVKFLLLLTLPFVCVAETADFGPTCSSELCTYNYNCYTGCCSSAKNICVATDYLFTPESSFCKPNPANFPSQPKCAATKFKRTALLVAILSVLCCGICCLCICQTGCCGRVPDKWILIKQLPVLIDRLRGSNKASQNIGPNQK